MPVSEVTLVLSDWTKGTNGKKCELPHVQMSSTIAEVKKQVVKALSVPNQKAEAILLFIGSLHLEEHMVLKEYNKSNRSKLNVDVYERVDLKLRVRTLQHAGVGSCVCVPIWSFLCRQTIPIDIPDHKTVGDLKRAIAEELDDPDKYTAENIKITFNNQMLFEDKKILKDVGLQKDSTITLFVDCCYWKKSHKNNPEKAAEEQKPVPVVEEPEDKPDEAAEAAAADKEGAVKEEGEEGKEGEEAQSGKASDAGAKDRSEKPSGPEE